jgi:hypothetical protein
MEFICKFVVAAGCYTVVFFMGDNFSIAEGEEGFVYCVFRLRSDKVEGTHRVVGGKVGHYVGFDYGLDVGDYGWFIVVVVGTLVRGCCGDGVGGCGVGFRYSLVLAFVDAFGGLDGKLVGVAYKVVCTISHSVIWVMIIDSPSWFLFYTEVIKFIENLSITTQFWNKIWSVSNKY